MASTAQENTQHTYGNVEKRVTAYSRNISFFEARKIEQTQEKELSSYASITKKEKQEELNKLFLVFLLDFLFH